MKFQNDFDDSCDVLHAIKWVAFYMPIKLALTDVVTTPALTFKKLRP